MKWAIKQIGSWSGKKAAGEGRQGSSPEQTLMEIDTDGDGVPDFFDPEPFENPEPFTPVEPKEPQNTCP